MRPIFLLLALSFRAFAEPPEPRFRAFALDDKIQIGYGVAVADVDGDQRPDVLLADKRQIVWYKNPGVPPPGAATLLAPIWNKFVIAEALTEKDHVCLAAQDIDGDGKCELAVGAEWNPGDTEKSGAVFYLIAPEDRQQRWTPVKFPSVEPTTHRMRWIKLEEKQWGLVVVPLHGRGNKNGEGAPVKVLLYHPPTPLNDPQGEWKSEVIDESMHMTHNFTELPVDPLDEPGQPRVVWIAGKESISIGMVPKKKGYAGSQSKLEGFRGAGEIRRLRNFGGVPVTIEPMHGNELVVYFGKLDIGAGKLDIKRHVLTDKLTEGHALATGEILKTGDDQIVVGWRGTPGKEGSTTGVAMWTPLDARGEQWRETMIDRDGMACEDLVLADLDADGRLDIVASGRATKNVKIYFNETPRP